MPKPRRGASGKALKQAEPKPASSPSPAREAIVPFPNGCCGCETLLPSDHVRMLVELLRPMGAELSRRWVAALLLVDRDERESMVEMVERHVSLEYARRVNGGV